LPQNTPGSPATLAGNRPSQQLDRDSYSVTALADITDRALHAATARFTAGVSPAALAEAYLDWATHLAHAPGKRIQLVDKAMRKAMRFGTYLQKYALSGGKTDDCIDPLPQDHRFTDEAWHKFPFNIVYQSFLLQQQWWHNATTGLRGVSKSHEDMVEFASRQILDMVAPSNFSLTNPESCAPSPPADSIWSKAFRTTWRTLSAPSRVSGRLVPTFRGRPRRGQDARQGHLSQSIDRAHSIRAGGRHGSAGTDPHYSGLYHEILHPRSFAA